MSRPGAPDLLEAIVAATRRNVDARKAQVPERFVAAAAERRQPAGDAFLFRLTRADGVNVIAECKRRSPSRGVLRADYDAAWIAERYEAHGAAAVSVLTERAFFDGSLDDLRAVRARVGLPLLCKDFIVDEYQLLEARAAGADAVLLIVAALGADVYRRLHASAVDLGLVPLAEVHRAAELDVALSANPRVVGVNNRNLATLEVDVATSSRLIDMVPDDVVAVAESGLRGNEDLQALRAAGFDAFLVGERLVTAADPGLALSELLTCS
jgi:indole-3-glycerol phosphate synthase